MIRPSLHGETVLKVIEMALLQQDLLDLSSRDSESSTAVSVLITRKDTILQNTFYDYWGDVHGVLAARGAGPTAYWQHHVDIPLAEFFPAALGFNQVPPEGAPVEGVAEITFSSMQGLATLVATPTVARMLIDEQNVLKDAYCYLSTTGNAVTLLDRLKTNAPSGRVEGFGVLLFLRKHSQASSAEFGDLLSGDFARILTSSKEVLKVRLHLFEPYDDQIWLSPNVNHTVAENDQYHGYYEIVFTDAADAKVFTGSATIAGLAPRIKALTSGVVTYPSDSTYTLVYGGRPTVAGLRGVSAAKTLMSVGDPANEKSLDLLQGLYGDLALQPFC